MSSSVEVPPRTYVKHDNQRVSIELRPDSAGADVIRDLARELERAGCVAEGASASPRFVPHLTMLRCRSVASLGLPLAASAAVAPPVTSFDSVVTFGDGRIIVLVPTMAMSLAAVRDVLLRQADPAALDPVVHDRPWTPHVTVAYEVVEDPALRARALEVVAASLPMTLNWSSLDAWYLDERPTRLLERIELDHGGRA